MGRTNCMGVPFDDQDEEVEETEEGEEVELMPLQRTGAANRGARQQALAALAASLRAFASALELLDDEAPGVEVAPAPAAPAPAAPAPVPTRRAREVSRRHDESPRARILRLLAERAEPLTISDIATALGLDRLTVTRRLFDLARKLEVVRVAPGLYEAVKS